MKTLQILVIVLALYSGDVQSKFYSSTIAMERLMMDLFVQYTATNIPTRKGVPVDVNVQILLEHFDFQESDGTFHFVGNLIMSWQDGKLAWNPSDYNNITEIPVSQKLLWVPDLEIYNNVPQKFLRSHSTGFVTLSHSGLLVWADKIEMNVICSPDMYNWPHDSHDCMIRLGSWTFNALELNLITKNNSDVNSMIFDNVLHENLEYRITKNETVLKSKIYECCDEPYISFDYSLTLERRCDFVVIFRMAAMCVVLLNLFSLLMQPHCVEKLWLNGISMIVITYQLIYFAKQIGNLTRTTPAIVIFFSCSFVLATLAQLIAVFSLMASRSRFKGPLPAICSRFLSCSLANCISNKANRTQQSVETHARFEDVNLQDSSNLITTIANPNEWTQLAVVLERGALVVFGIVYAIVGTTCMV